MSLLSSFEGGFSGLIATLTANGLTPAAALSAAKNLVGGTKNTVVPMISTMLADYNQPNVVEDELTKILEVSGLSNTAIAAIEPLPAACAAAAKDPTQMSALLSLVQNIENQL